jgi:MFS family permease
VSSAIWGTASAFFTPASTGVVPDTVSPARLQQANALLGLTRSVVGLGGPILSGLLVASVGTGVVFAIDSASFIASAFFLLQLRLPKKAVVGGARFVAQLVAGWREVVTRTWLWVSILVWGARNVANAVFFVLGPLVVSSELGGARDWGFMMSGFAFGAIAGGVIALRYRPRRPLAAMFVISIVSGLPLLLLVPPAPVAVLVFATLVVGIAVSSLLAIWTTTLQEQVPERALSRVSAYDWLGSLVTMPIGFALAGPVADLVGVDATLIGAACLMSGASLIALAVPGVRAVRRREVPDLASEDAAAPRRASQGEPA